MAFADPDKFDDWNAGKEPVEVLVHEKVARHYGAPFIDLAREVYDRISAGEFTWKYDFKDLHPSPFGQEIYFSTIKTLLASNGTGAGPVVSKALNPFSYSKARYESVRRAEKLQGFHFVDSWKPADGKSTRAGFVGIPMLVGESEGTSFELQFEGRAIGLAIVSGPDAGVISYRVDGNKEKQLDLRTQWSNQLHLPWYLILEDELKPGKHKLKLTLLPRPSSGGEGSACRIAHFLVAN